MIIQCSKELQNNSYIKLQTILAFKKSLGVFLNFVMIHRLCHSFNDCVKVISQIRIAIIFQRSFLPFSYLHAKLAPRIKSTSPSVIPLTPSLTDFAASNVLWMSTATSSQSRRNSIACRVTLKDPGCLIRMWVTLYLHKNSQMML